MALEANSMWTFHSSTMFRKTTVMKKKILLVEDNKPLALALKMRLDALGYNLITADNVASAMSSMAKRKPDISLIDVNLPDGTGFDFAKQIKNNPNMPEIPVIFISASRDPGYRTQAINYSSIPLLEKPFNAEQLIYALEHTQNTAQKIQSRSLKASTHM